MQRILRPARGLEPFVRYYTTRRMTIAGAPVMHPVTARAIPMLEFNIGEAITVKYRDGSATKKSTAVVVIGPQTCRRLDLELYGSLESFNIMFQPDGLARLFSVPMTELADADYDGPSVLGGFISEVHQRVGECGSVEECVRIVDALLLRHACGAASCDGITAAANQMLVSAGQVSIARLADAAGLGMRQFERRFVQRIGIRPKLFARIARFEAALDGKARFTARSWSQVAQQFGYYDQMHMIHDFAEFTGETPTQTLTQLESVFAHRLAEVRSTRRGDGSDGESRIFF